MTGKWSHSDWRRVLEAAAEQALPAIGASLEGQAALLAPVDTGRLRGSITYATRRERSRPDAPAQGSDEVSQPSDVWTLHVGTNVSYAEHVEYGTRRTAAQPYLRLALDRGKKGAQAVFGKAISKAIQQYGQ